MHLKVKNFKCETCGREFFKSHQLKNHLIAHRGIRFQCFITGCTKSVTRRDNLVSHMKNGHRLTAEEQDIYMGHLNDYCAQIKRI